MPIEPLAIGVCSWSLQVTSIPELKGFMDRLGVDVVQIACGDPTTPPGRRVMRDATSAKVAGFRMSGSMLGFPGEDYSSPQTIEKRGVRDPATRLSGSERFKWALARTQRSVSPTSCCMLASSRRWAPPNASHFSTRSPTSRISPARRRSPSRSKQVRNRRLCFAERSMT